MNQVIIITGASSGLGLSLAKKFIQLGDIVYGVSKTKKRWKHAEQTVNDSGRFSLYEVDVTSESQVRSFISLVHKKAGRIQTLINSAGYAGRLANIQDLELEEFQKNVSGNLISSFLMCKYTIPILRKQKSGLIVNVSSMAGKRAVPRLGAYSASKFGVLALSQSIANTAFGGSMCTISTGNGITSTTSRAKSATEISGSGFPMLKYSPWTPEKKDFKYRLYRITNITK